MVVLHFPEYISTFFFLLYFADQCFIIEENRDFLSFLHLFALVNVENGFFACERVTGFRLVSLAGIGFSGIAHECLSCYKSLKIV